MATRNSKPLITVAICTRNRAPLLEKAVSSVLSQITDDEELLIVDNASTDGTAEKMREMAAFNPCMVVCGENEIGISVARNTALKKARGEFVLFLDDDAVPELGWLAAYQIFLSTLPSEKIAVVGGAVIPEYEVPPPRWMDAEKRFEMGNEPECFPLGGSTAEGNSAYRRVAVMEAGMFDKQLGHKGGALGYREGSDLNLRLQNKGYEIWWLPGAAVRHLIHANRLNLGWALRSAFNEGRSIAIQRLNRNAEANRIVSRMVRVLISPFHFGINLMLAFVLWPFQQGRLAARALRHAMRIAGFAWELLVISK
jgi:glycosyltransferase involved in cell wall biosynthesis